MYLRLEPRLSYCKTRAAAEAVRYIYFGTNLPLGATVFSDA